MEVSTTIVGEKKSLLDPKEWYMICIPVIILLKWIISHHLGKNLN